MIYYFIGILILSSIISLKRKKDLKKKKLLIGVYALIISGAFLYNFGYIVGELIYSLQY